MLGQGEHQCEQCGSRRLRRARARRIGHRLLKLVAPVERYACGSCGHRGWRRKPERPGTALGSRPLEARDIRARVRFRRNVLRNTLIAIALGCAAAFAVIRMIKPE